MCDFLDCKYCRTMNYIDPWYFWNWKGKIACAGCGKVYYVEYSNGLAAPGTPKEMPEGEKPDELVLYADKPLNGYEFIRPGTPGKTRPYFCLMRDPKTYTGRARRITHSIRGYPLRAWAPQAPSAHVADSHRHDDRQYWVPEAEKLKLYPELLQKQGPKPAPVLGYGWYNIPSDKPIIKTGPHAEK